MHFLAAVHRQHHVAHLAVEKLDILVLEIIGVGGDGEAEGLARLFLQLTAVGHQLLDHAEVEHRFPAEEIDLEELAAAGALDQEFQRALTDIQRHQQALAVEGAGGGETVAAAQVAVVRHQQAHRLDDAGLHLLFGRNRVQRRIIGKERTAGNEDFDLLDHFL